MIIKLLFDDLYFIMAISFADLRFHVANDRLDNKHMKDGTYQYYAGNMVYKNDKSLNYLLFDEGLVTKTSSVYSYEYHLKDHLGNTRVTFQPNGSTTTTTQVAEYYPFGSSYLPISPAGTNKYLYNGKEKQDDILSSTALDWYDYGARFYDPQIGRFLTQDRFAEKYSSLSPYNDAGNNPILLIDVNGDSLAIDQSIYSNKVLNQAFQIFANSKAGRAYLSQFAKAGQTLYGHKFLESGKYDKEGMNMAYTTGKSENSENGNTYGDNSNKTITITMCTDQIKDESNESIYSATQTFTHESFIHGDLNAEDYMRNGSFNGSNISQKAKDMAYGYRANFQHYQVYLNYAKNGYNTQWPGQGYSVLQQANSILKLNKTPDQVVQQMWNFSGGAKIDHEGKVTEFIW